jgi:hypothetical protein
MKTAGLITLFGSGETSPGAQKIYHALFSQMSEAPRVAILETPAGFEPNSDYVAGQVAAYLQKRLQNFRPETTVVPARKRGTAFSPDAPAIVAPLHGANVIFMGPGSPSYAVRQLTDTLAWHTLRARHRLGASLIFSSAMVLAASRHTLPIYEIYKVGEDLHWKAGLDFFGDFGLSLIFVSHWNNGDGGEVLDTSRCYLGQARFGQLLAMLPADPTRRVVGIDENTALTIDLAGGRCTVRGAGGVTILHDGAVQRFAAGAEFDLAVLGELSRAPTAQAGIPAPIWDTAVAQSGVRAPGCACRPTPRRRRCWRSARRRGRPSPGWKQTNCAPRSRRWAGACSTRRRGRSWRRCRLGRFDVRGLSCRIGVRTLRFREASYVEARYNNSG